MVYMGSKNRIAKYIIPFLIEAYKPGMTYVEPFCGGCNMIDKIPFPERWAFDYHPLLIILLKALQSGWVPPLEVSQEEYNTAKAILNKKNDFTESELINIAYIGFVCSFHGKFFAGYTDKYKRRENDVIRQPITEKRNNLMRQLPNLQTVKFGCADYDEIDLPDGSLIYCDPPYLATTKYTVSDFDHEKFWNWCREKVKEGHKVFVSEYVAPDDFVSIWSKTILNNLKSGETKDKVVENLFIHISQK